MVSIATIPFAFIYWTLTSFLVVLSIIVLTIAVLQLARDTRKRDEQLHAALRSAQKQQHVLQQEFEKQQTLRNLLHQEDERFRTLFQHTPVGIFLYDARLRLTECNDRFVAIFQSSHEKLNDLPLDRLHDQSIVPALKAPLDGKPGFYEGPYEATTSSVHVWMRMHTSPLFDSAQKVAGAVGIVEDITARVAEEEERGKLEEQLQQTQKLESLGVLAGGIAHDFNNLLMAILGNADLALMELDDSPAVEMINGIKQTSRRAAELCKQLLAYAGQGQFVVEPVSIERVVRSMSQLVETSIAKRVTARYDIAPDLPLIEADITQFRQVILNLLLNGAEAIGDKDGTVTLRAYTVALSREDLRSFYLGENLPAGTYVAVTVEDTGCGMDNDTAAKIFDPFFSTKFTGRGLGLAAVLGILKTHKGAIKVESAPGEGSTFSLILPQTRQKAASHITDTSEVDSHRAGGTILVVDDDMASRTMSQRMLEKAGFKVLVASSGQDGIRKLKMYSESITAVLLDFMMPGLNGKQTLDRMRQVSRTVPVIICSGYGKEGAMQEFEPGEVASFLAKPYDTKQLVNVVTSAVFDAPAH